MKRNQYSFDLPEKLIAQYPSPQRDECRLMVGFRKNGKIEHKLFRDVLDYFREGDTLILNNTRVFPAALTGKKDKTSSDIEVFLQRELIGNLRYWDVLVEPARKIRVGNKLLFGEGGDVLVAEVIDNTTSRGRVLRFLFDGSDEEFMQRLRNLGRTPLPAMINRPAEKSDLEHYQTVFASEERSVAAPTAGLHFSKSLLFRLELKDVHLAYVTLHPGLGNFRQIEVEDLNKHKVDSEPMEVKEEAAQIINTAIQANKKVCAVGTTVLRTLESSVSSQGLIMANKGWTSEFILPPRPIQVCKSLITNFHMPQSIPMINASAVVGIDFLQEMYAVALKEEYKFGTYGDAMLFI